MKAGINIDFIDCKVNIKISKIKFPQIHLIHNNFPNFSNLINPYELNCKFLNKKNDSNTLKYPVWLQIEARWPTVSRKKMTHYRYFFLFLGISKLWKCTEADLSWHVYGWDIKDVSNRPNVSSIKFTSNLSWRKWDHSTSCNKDVIENHTVILSQMISNLRCLNFKCFTNEN